MVMVGWVELILIVAVLILFAVIYLVYWIGERNLVVGFTSLIIGSAYFLILGIWGLFNVYVAIAKGSVSFSDSSNIMSLAFSLLCTGLGIYGLNSVYRNLRTVFVVLRKHRTKMD
jgi:hypothetical protein